MLVLAASLVSVALSGCSMTRWLAVASGEYIVTPCQGETYDAAPLAVRQLRIDRNDDVAVFTLANGAEIAAALTPRNREDWPSGCPTNVFDHRMEVLDVDAVSLPASLVGPGTPVLVHDCPRDPVRIVLRPDGDIGNARASSGTACSWTDSCICFKPVGDRTGQVSENAVASRRR